MGKGHSSGGGGVVNTPVPEPQNPLDLMAAMQPDELAQNMMLMGRPSFNWGLMGAVAPLAGMVPQPAYTTPPPAPSLDFWKEWEQGMPTTNAPFPFAPDWHPTNSE